MHSADRKLLNDKLTANQQRRVAELFLARLPLHLEGALSNARVIVAPESERIACHHYVDERGVGVDSPFQPADFFFAPFHDPWQVFDALTHFGDAADLELGYFRPTGFSTSEPPLFEVLFGWVRLHFLDLYMLSNRHCSLTTRNGEAGISTTVVHGYSDRHADESVFELSYWGSRRQ